MNIQKITWNGLDAVEITTNKLHIIGVYSYGPRISSLKTIDGENILLWEPQKYTRGDWDLRGGHRCWHAGINADECEMTYNTDNNPATCEILSNGFILTGAPESTNKIRRGIKVTVTNENRLEVDSFTINDSDLLFGVVPWALTCTIPSDNTEYIIPLGDNSSFDTATIVLFKEWAGHGQKHFKDDQFLIEEDAMVIKPNGKENKRMVQSAAGIIVMNDKNRNICFGKKREFSSLEKYPLSTNVAAYIGPDNFMVEMETMGSETCLKPAQISHHVEIWIIKNNCLCESTGKAAKALFD